MARSTTPESGRDRFNRLSDQISRALGSIQAVALSVGVVVVWALIGPFVGYSDTWQLVINTGTTVVTFWMVFVLQNSQNRNARALHLKLDEIIRVTKDARNELMDAEEATEDEIEDREREFRDAAEGEAEPRSGAQL